mgnify:FL=1
MSTGAFSLGKNKWDPTMGSCEIDYTSAGEFKHVNATGTNDARQTWLGRHNAVIKVQLVWKDDTRPDSEIDGPTDSAVTAFLAAISPRGPSGGQAWAWVEQDQGIHAVTDVTVEKLTTKRVPGSGKGTASIELFSWVKPIGAAITVTKTPNPPNKWQPGAPSKPTPPGSPPKNFTDSKPKVNP